ncbi:putative RING-H2 finger protein ATL12 [Nymphaea colorata]|uniref:putative RING-H2 finger protein ATL12 n=1 Tax=Nymphaea colorata TaxID=210225 RepID=UPI00129ED0BF|nr:putative RING-H2 finger protein ATL12 [Nymphaea colorata]
MNPLFFWLCFTFGLIPCCFILSFVLFILAEFISGQLNCRSNSGAEVSEWPREIISQDVLPTYSGVDRKLIASLPLCRFSSLGGPNFGHECAVCLSKFEDLDILHLLPKCRHVFHVSCIDEWLEMNSTCPLCRQDVTAHDITLFKYSWKLSCSQNRDQSAKARSGQLPCSKMQETDHENGLPFLIADSSSFIKKDDGDHEQMLPSHEIAIPNNLDLVFLNSISSKQPSTMGNCGKGDVDMV